MKTNGAMHLMVYGRYGRTGISMLKEYCGAVGVGTSEQEITDLIATLVPVTRDHPAAAHLREATLADGKRLFFGPPAGTGEGAAVAGK